MKRLLLATFCLFSCFVYADPTPVTVRVRAKDAKFIGTGIGGAHIVIKNKITGAILAQGLTAGSSGNTAMLLQKPVERWQRITDENTAHFTAWIDADEPTLLSIEATGPISRRNAAVKVSTEVWIIPGKPIDEDGIVMELPGLIVDFLSPTTHEFIDQASLPDRKLSISASVTLMCGCTITDGGVWDAKNVEVEAIVKFEGRAVGNLPLKLTPKANIFSANLQVSQKGNYQVIIHAFDKKTKNTGVDIMNFVVQ